MPDSFAGNTRRDFLGRAFAGIGALSLSNVLRQRAEAGANGAAGERQSTSLILLWQDGGPSPFETFDPKPLAPAEYRGELGAIATSLPGVEFCEILPRLARLANRLAILRSLHQPYSGHVEGSRYFITGYEAEPTGSIAYPDLGAVVHRARSGREGPLPNYVATGPYAAGLHRGGAAYLGTSFQPFVVHGEPGSSDFRVDQFMPNEAIATARFQQRRGLLGEFDLLRREWDASSEMEAVDRFQRRALDLLTSPAAAAAFDLRREDQRVRDRYGLHTAGQQALLARRLVEAGVSVVAVRFCPDARGEGDRSGVGWDDHAVHGNIFTVMRARGPQFDQAVSALVEDLQERGLDRQVLLVVAGEFGRTPRISYANGETFNTGYGPGRDHWGNAGCAMLFGGGMPMGQVIGATNRWGEYPVERAVRPQDLLATIYRHLGVDPRQEFVNLAGRPIPVLPFGNPIAELNG